MARSRLEPDAGEPVRWNAAEGDPDELFATLRRWAEGRETRRVGPWCERAEELIRAEFRDRGHALPERFGKWSGDRDSLPPELRLALTAMSAAGVARDAFEAGRHDEAAFEFARMALALDRAGMIAEGLDVLLERGEKHASARRPRDPRTTERRKAAAALRARGLTHEQIAKRMQSDGWRSASGGEVTRSVVAGLLRNPPVHG